MSKHPIHAPIPSEITAWAATATPESRARWAAIWAAMGRVAQAQAARG